MPSVGAETSGYETPVFRRGLVVRAVSAGAQGGSTPIRRTASEAQELGRLIADALQTYLDAIKDGIVGGARDIGLDCDVPRELPDQVARARYAPGLIIDFPAHETTIDGLVVRERTCITICQYEDASKIWTRLLLRGSETEPADVERTRRFFWIANALSQRVIQEVRKIYHEHFVSQPSAARERAQFEDVGQLDFYGFDERALRLSDGGGGDAASDAVHIDFLKRKFAPLVETITKTPKARDRFESLGPSDMKYCSGGTSKPSLYATLFEPKRAIFLVLSEAGADDAESIAAPGVERPSGALTAMRTLATEVGREF